MRSRVLLGFAFVLVISLDYDRARGVHRSVSIVLIGFLLSFMVSGSDNIDRRDLGFGRGDCFASWFLCLAAINDQFLGFLWFYWFVGLIRYPREGAAPQVLFEPETRIEEDVTKDVSEGLRGDGMNRPPITLAHRPLVESLVNSFRTINKSICGIFVPTVTTNGYDLLLNGDKGDEVHVKDIGVHGKEDSQQKAREIKGISIKAFLSVVVEFRCGGWQGSGSSIGG
ncbi:hypothetical protein L6452_34645 [Arctium lappa]|uniref:Uncharacterized protein n=1 Tax=Arctium lappa TaxID=4217 RepID=A0ACB8YJD2_ARCLA|nr:hypothetical protein L6452_34645 [Arctium lappa]